MPSFDCWLRLVVSPVPKCEAPGAPAGHSFSKIKIVLQKAMTGLPAKQLPEDFRSTEKVG
jgi:hypothetical protein